MSESDYKSESNSSFKTGAPPVSSSGVRQIGSLVAARQAAFSGGGNRTSGISSSTSRNSGLGSSTRNSGLGAHSTKYICPSDLVSSITPKEIDECKLKFISHDVNRDGSLDESELKTLLLELGENVTDEIVADLIKEVDRNTNGKIEYGEFLRIIVNLRKGKKVTKQANMFMTPQAPKANLYEIDGATGKHSYSEEEKVAFSDHINRILGADEFLKDRLPLNPQGMDLFTALRDGILLSKLINKAVSDTVDERALNFPKGEKELSVYQINENQNVAINAAKAIGCKVVNIHNQDLIEGTPHLCLGLVWQIVRIQLLGQINLKEHPELVRLLEEGEELADLLKLPPDQILLRWINYHLKNAGHPRRVANFGKDLQDSECYTILLDQIGKCGKEALGMTDMIQRASKVISNAKGLGVESFIIPENIATGNQKLNLAFCAQIFNTCPGLTLSEKELQDMAEFLDDDIGDTREERVFRMWINSLGLEDANINNLFEDLRDGVIILQVMDKIEQGLVVWNKVNRPPKNKFKKVENTNYAVVLGKQLKFSLVGIGGVDIVNGNKKLILSLVWQMMRLHSLKMLSELGQSGQLASDQDILTWANEKVRKAGKESSMESFKDPSLSTSLFFFDLCSALAPGIVNDEIVTPGETPEDKQSNAKYVISVARKLGATVFLTWEDIVEVKPKMLMTFTASLMLWDATAPGKAL